MYSAIFLRKGNKYMKERQVIVSWYTPSEKLPESDNIVLATVNAKAHGFIWNKTFMLLEYSHHDQCWYALDVEVKPDELEVLAWCDIEPY